MVFGIANLGKARLVGTLLAALLLATGCQPGGRATPAAKASGTGASATASPSPTPPAKHVFVIVLENSSYQLALRQPYIASVANQYAVATSYSSVASPSCRITWR